MIGVVSGAADVHYRCVARELDMLGVAHALLELPKLGNGARFSVAFGSQQHGRFALPEQKHEVELDRFSCIWYRRYFAPVLAPTPAASDDGEWVQREWRDALNGTFNASQVRAVSAPHAQELAAVKPYQLRVAERVGLRIPDTLLSNDAAAARSFIAAHAGRVVHKILTAPKQRFLATKRWDGDAEQLLDQLYLAPTLFQEQIEAPHELRITIVGRQVFAARFPVAERVIDARTDLDVPYAPHTLPDNVTADLLALMDRLELSYATIDMKQRSDGSYVFLELNPQGQFLYVEVKSGLPIARALARFLANADA